VETGDHEVWLTIPVEIANDDRIGTGPGVERGDKAEGAVAVARQHADCAGESDGSLIRDGHVQHAVAIEVSHRHGKRIRADDIAGGGLKGAVPLAQQDAYR